jgi:DNA-binding NarL/FixJ family response regulator
VTVESWPIRLSCLEAQVDFGSVTTTCVIADDHPAVVQAVADTLRAAGFEVIPCIGGTAALEAIKQHKPDVAILDGQMPDMGGVEVVRRANRTKTRFVLYTAFGDRAILQDALDAGVLGYVLKETPPEGLREAIARAREGASWIDPRLTPLLLGITADETPTLSPREREVLKLLSDGLGNEEIGKQLFISPDTVRTHVRRAMTKLGASNRTQAVAMALRKSLIA